MQKVLVFGVGKLFAIKENYIRNHFDIVGFLDNQIRESGCVYGDTNIPVYHPESIEKILQKDMQILLMSYDYVSMWRQLYGLGISEEKILFGVMFPPFPEWQEILFEQGRYLAAEGSNIFYYEQNKKIVVENHGQIEATARELLRREYREKYPLIQAIAKMDTRPVSRKFGVERGNAIDRYYIEDFLEKNKELVHGDCLEIAENTYTLKYGEDRVSNSYVLHLKGWGDNAIKGNLETGEGIEPDKYDCAIITQTLMFIFDIQKVVANIYKLLKRGGNALVTVAGISQISRTDADLWGSYYGFHKDAIKRFFVPIFGEENVKIHSYGNVKTAVAMLCGLCQEDLVQEDFTPEDPDYPVILSIVLKKK